MHVLLKYVLKVLGSKFDSFLYVGRRSKVTNELLAVILSVMKTFVQHWIALITADKRTLLCIYY